MKNHTAARKSTSVRLDPHVLPRLKKVAAAREVTQAEAIEQAVDKWIQQDSDLPEGERRIAVPSAYAKIAERLARVLAVLESERDDLVRATIDTLLKEIRWLEVWVAERRGA